MKFSKIVKNSFSLEFNSLAKKMNDKKDKIISFGLGEAYFSPPKKLNFYINKAINEGYNRYSHPNGIIKLRKTLSKKYNSSLNNFIITAGAKPALSLVLSAILNKNDEVIFFDPSYPSYKSQIKIANLETKIIKLNLDLNFRIDFNILNENLNKNTKAIIINTPHNPTGNVISRKELNQIVNLSKKFNFYVLIDAVYQDLNFTTETFEKIKSNPKVIIISSFSKMLGITGWRIGYLYTTNKKVLDSCSFIQKHTNTNTNTFLQKAVSDYLDTDEKFIENFKNKLKKRIEYMKKKLATEKLEIIYPDGGFFLFLNISNLNISSDRFAYLLLKNKKIAVTPGIVFGKKWDKFVRICFATSQKDFVTGIRGLKEFIDEI